MLTQADLKRYRSLQQKKYRGEHRRFLVQGRKVVEEVLASRLRTEVLLCSEEAAKYIKPQASQAKVPLQILAGHELDKIGTFEKGNELIAIVEEPASVAFRPLAAGELVLALDGVRDPRNMGGLLRIADWFGHTRLLASHDCMELWNPKCVQSAMGSLFRVQVRRCTLADELLQLKQRGAAIYLADMHGTSVFDCALRRPAVLVLGSESHGLSAALRALEAQLIAIPKLGSAESLNVAMAASALCTEFARQHRS